MSICSIFLCILCAGDRYVVVDCGGGTVDLTVHQIRLPEGHLKELYKASGKKTYSSWSFCFMQLGFSSYLLLPGGPYGSLGIDYEFEKLLCKIFGQDFIDQFKVKRPAAWVDLMIAFESRKRAAAPDRTNPLNINLPFSFIDYYKKFRGHSVEHALRKSKWVHKHTQWSTVLSGSWRWPERKEKDQHFTQTALVVSKARSSRPKVTTPLEDRYNKPSSLSDIKTICI